MSTTEKKALAKAGLAGEGVSHGLKLVGKTHAWVGRLGGADRLVFTDGGAVQVGLGAVDLARLVAALAELEKVAKTPDAAVVASAEALALALGQGKRAEWELTATVPISGVAVDLTPSQVTVQA